MTAYFFEPIAPIKQGAACVVDLSTKQYNCTEKSGNLGRFYQALTTCAGEWAGEGIAFTYPRAILKLDVEFQDCQRKTFVL